MLEPAIATWLLSMSARLGAAGASGFLAPLLQRSTVRWRVAWSVSKSASTRGIQIKRSTLRGWLARPEVQRQLSTGSETELESCLNSLAETFPTASTTRIDDARTILDLALDEYLRKVPVPDAIATSGRRTSERIDAAKAYIVKELTANPTQLEADVDRLHPWRREVARDIASRWSPLTFLVHELVMSPDRASVLRQWGQSPPTQLDDAPADAWVLLAVIAGDYDERAAAARFMTSAIERGATPANYLWARLGQITITDEGEIEEARGFLERSEPRHPLAEALLLLIVDDTARADEVLEKWRPTSQSDRATRQSLRINCAVARKELNAAITLGLEGCEQESDSSGLALRTAGLLLSRGQHGPTDDQLADFGSALELALRARDARRKWEGDSAAATLLAVRASTLGHDLKRAWELTQLQPAGEATPNEFADARVRSESAILAAMMGRRELALEIAAEQGNDFVSATVHGFAALNSGDASRAEDAWFRAWASALDDSTKLQTLSALAHLGRRLPDLTELEKSQPEAVRELRSVHQIMSSGDEKVALLRARSHESRQLTVLLAEELLDAGDLRGSARALEKGAERWIDAYMMRMAAGRYLQAGDYAEADETAARAIGLGGRAWVGVVEALMIRFDALESQGRQDESLVVARQIMQATPDNISARWVFIRCSLRHGDRDAAWNALNYQGEPIPPRERAEADVWIALLSEYDTSTLFFPRAMAQMQMWLSDPDVGGRFLMQIYLGLERRNVELSDDDLAELHAATEQFTESHPNSSTFKSISLGPPEDLLAPLEDELRANAENPVLVDAQARVGRGELPLGFLTRIHGAGYTEAALKRAAGRVYSHALEPRSTLELSAAATALGGDIVVDPTAAVTLALLSDKVADLLVGAFQSVSTTDAAFRDALAAQYDANMLSTMSITWDTSAQRARPVEIADEVAARLATHSDRTLDILTRMIRRAWPTLHHFTKLPDEVVWLSAADHAITRRVPFWCDDRVLREMVEAEGIPTFGTIDLLRAQASAGIIDPRLAKASEGTLVHNYHVDLGFDIDVMRLAAQLSGWAPEGAAHALTRPATWQDPERTLIFSMEACVATSAAEPEHLRNWIQASAIGLIAIQPTDPLAAATNVRALLERTLAQTWMRPDILPFVVDGIRDAINASSEIADPFEAVMRTTFRTLADRGGFSYAGEFLLALVRQLPESDRLAVAGVILTNR